MAREGARAGRVAVMPAVGEELEPYRHAYEHLRKERGHADPAWLAPLRRSAMARFEALGFPTASAEAWRHTSVAAIARRALVPGDGGLRLGAVGPTLARLGFGGAFHGREMVFVNGRHAPDLSACRQPGVVAMSLREALPRFPALIEPHLGRIARDEGHAFAALNTAFLDDGALVHVKDGASLEDPIHLLFVSTTGGGEACVSHPRVLVLAGRGSRATLVESYGGPNGEVYLTNAVTEIRLEDGARLERIKLERESLAAFHLASVEVSLGPGAGFADHSLAVGGSLARTDLNVELAGEGAEVSLDGLFVGDGQQLLDTHTRIDHARPRCASREVYKGILSGRARGVFHGRILVRRDAQKTDAHQANKNLLLSPEALVHSTPQLEILADDVKCKHGSTTGQLDRDALFYLRSRGISEQAARSLLTWAFASDLVARMPVKAVRAAVETFLHDRLPSAPRESVA